MHEHRETLEIEDSRGERKHSRYFKHHHKGEDKAHTHIHAWMGTSSDKTKMIVWEGSEEEK
jgi:hypothetical protein